MFQIRLRARRSHGVSIICSSLPSDFSALGSLSVPSKSLASTRAGIFKMTSQGKVLSQIVETGRK
jgi:hypothetical protein